jgi:putative transcriptional regulator
MQRMQTERGGCRRRAVSKERRARVESRIVPLGLVCLAALDVLAVDIPAAEQTNSTAGQLLVATADMRDPRFVETVIYIVKHSSEGAFGLVINRPLAKGPIGDLLKGFGMNTKGAKGEIVIHYGGPVGADQGFVLHSDEVLLDSSTKIKDGIAMTSDAKLIEAMSRGKGPRQSLFTLGYAGWAPGQLEAELKANAWYVIPADKGLVFGKDAEKKWREAMDKRQISL